MSGRTDGYNPLLWNCTTQGCFNDVKRPKIEELADCLPGKIGFTDVDGIVELGGRFLLLEWKSPDRPRISDGQRMLFERFTKTEGNVVIVVCGKADTMDVFSIGYFHRGTFHQYETGDLARLKRLIRRWAKHAAPGRAFPEMRLTLEKQGYLPKAPGRPGWRAGT